MVRRKIIEDTEAGKFGLRVTNPGGIIGWLVGEHGEVRLYATEKEAKKALKAMLSNTNYSWNNPVEVVLFPGEDKAYGKRQ